MTAAYVLATYGGGRRELGAALVFTTVNLLGTFVFLLSVAGVYHVTGTLDMARSPTAWPTPSRRTALLIAVGFFVAFSVKLGLFPFHFWLPTVYTGASPAVAAILSGGAGEHRRLRAPALRRRDAAARARAGRRRADRHRLRVDRLRRRAGGVPAHRERDARLLGDRPGRLRPGRHRRRRAGRLRGGDPLRRRQRAEQDAAVPHAAHARRAGRAPRSSSARSASPACRRAPGSSASSSCSTRRRATRR